jgi:hypothetical protein
MNSVEQRLPGAGMVGTIVFPILALVVLYYLYRWLFGPSGLEGKQVLNSIKDARPDKPYITTATDLPAMYEGGEYAINGWVYINDYSIRRGLNKHVFSLGGSSYLTLAVFLGPYKNTLSVRVHTKDAGNGVVAAGASPNPQNASDDLSMKSVQTMFTSVQPDNGLLNGSRPCDIPSIDMQKWVQITVCLNGKTVDVYMDGKLARSCILPATYKVDKSNLALRVCEYNGFGGFVSNVSAYNYALNPEQIWRLYMAGPGAQYGFLDYLTSLFDPKAVAAFDYPKQNITG